MKLDYRTTELSDEIKALTNLFGSVTLVDPQQGVTLAPDTLQAGPAAGALPALDETGRGIQLGENGFLTMAQAITVEGRPCVLVLKTPVPGNVAGNVREENSLHRAITQYQEDLRRDYVTGAYNSRYVNNEYRRYAEREALTGQRVGVVMARVNEYANLAERENAAAADCCLNTAAGILQLAVGLDHDAAILARLQDGMFLMVTVGDAPDTLARTVREALESSRREFNISLSRRGEFTVDLATAEWAETANWEMMLALAQQRLAQQ